MREGQWRAAFADEGDWFAYAEGTDGRLVGFAKGTLHDGGVPGFQGELGVAAHRHRFAELHGQGNRVPDLVGSVRGWRTDVRNGRRDAVDDDILIRAQRPARAGVGEGQYGVVPGRVADRAAVERQGRRRNVVEVDRGMPGGDGVIERQYSRPAATGVVDNFVGGSGFQSDLRRAGNRDGFGESHGDRDQCADSVIAARSG